MLSEMEQTIEHFAAELEEQNQALIEMFAETKKEYELHHAKLALRLEQLEKQNDLLQRRVGELSDREPGSRSASVPQPEAGVSSGPSGHEEAARGQASALYLAAEPEPAPASLMNVKERYSELFQLYSQGKSTDVIAKKLGMNKGKSTSSYSLPSGRNNRMLNNKSLLYGIGTGLIAGAVLLQLMNAAVAPAEEPPLRNLRLPDSLWKRWTASKSSRSRPNISPFIIKKRSCLPRSRWMKRSSRR
ncbi:hypothetical protein LJK88_22395 [Paenibacillus sp. P26]|nr:hypothetical protein LJK88_22395 [Paenibacillus sp. P26]